MGTRVIVQTTDAQGLVTVEVVSFPVTVITVRAPHKAGELTNCGDWKPLESGSGMVRTCEVSK